MTDREAMRLALEALNLPSLKTQQMLQQRDEAITALQEKLAEEALQRLTDVQQKIEAVLEQPEQEPVAWMSQAGNFLSPLEFTVGEAALYGWTPVYTTPPAPQRKPLTEEELTNIVREVSKGSALRPMRAEPTSIRIARAIEQAHGIGKKP